MPGDLLITGARIRTLDPGRPYATAIAARDGILVHVGDDASARAQAPAGAEHVDGAGLAVVPGLIDAHLHPLDGTDHTPGADLSGCRTLDAVRGALRDERERAGDGWVLGHGLDYGAFAASGIHHAALDDVLGDAPAFLRFYDVHTALASRPALALAGVTGPREFDQAAEIVCDADGRPTGELREWGAIALVESRLPAPTREERLDAYARTLRAFNAAGLTGGHAMVGSPAMLDDYAELEARGALTLRTVVALKQEPDVSDEQIAAHIELRDAAGRRWRGGVAKFFIDGVVETGTAWLLGGDARGESRAPFWPDPGRYAAVVAAYARAGFQCVTHAVGDAAVRCALDAYRAAGAAPGVRHRVEHIEILDDADLGRFAAEDVIASMQPVHLDGTEEGSAWRAPLRAGQVDRAWRVADLRAAGALIAFGSDWPVASFDPRLGMAWARLRRAPGDPGAPVLGPTQAVGAEDALRGFTTAAAAAVGADARLVAGNRADFTAFAEDPVDCPADALAELPVRLTVVDGAVVHRAG